MAAQTTRAVLRLRLMGHMAVEDSSGQVSLPRARKTRAILAVLALASPRPVMRLTLTALLWSQRQTEQARASLRQAVHELQDLLGTTWGGLLHAERHHLALHGPGLSVDALAIGESIARPIEALRLFQNDLLEDLTGLDPAFDHWLVDERTRLRRAAIRFSETALASQDSPDDALETAELVLQLDRAHEGAWRSIMRHHAEHGDRTGAIRVYEQCRGVLAQLGVAGPSRETEDLRDRIGGPAPWDRIGGPAPSAKPYVDLMVPAATDSATPPPRRTSIRLGVLPLRLIDPSQAGRMDELAAVLAEEVTTSLARFRWLSCVSGSSLTALGGLVSAGQLTWNGTEVDFVLDGLLQRNGHRVRILMRIIDMRAGGEVIWARRFDREASDTLALQDDLTAEIVAQVEPELLMREGEREGRPVALASAHELVLRAIPAIYRMDSDGFRAAGAVLEEALVVDPSHASAHAWYAYWHLFLIGQGWADDPNAAALRAEALAERAVTLDPNDARALTLAGHTRGYLGRAREACALHERAIALNPNLALAWCFSGLALSYLGEHEDALIRLRQASRMSPSDPHSFFFDMATMLPHLLLGEYEKAVEFGRRAIELNPGFSSSYKLYAAALGHLGREQEAKKAVARLLMLEPAFSVADAIERAPMTRPEDLARYAEGLRRAGLPERVLDRGTEDVDFRPPPPHTSARRGAARA